MSATADDDFEHWATDSKVWAEQPAAARGYDSNNGLHHHAYHPAKAPTPEAPASIAPPLAPQAYHYDQPFYYAHGPTNAPQYRNYPPPTAQYYHQPAPQGYYTYATRAPAPAPAPQRPSAPANVHTYQPAYSEPKTMPAPTNSWMGRTKAEVEEDNMKIAKREGANDKRKIVPAGVADDQLLWVVELDESIILRRFAEIKDMNGTWKKDPRFDDVYYFMCEKVEEKK